MPGAALQACQRGKACNQSLVTASVMVAAAGILDLVHVICCEMRSFAWM